MWESACLACSRPWVQSPVKVREEKNKLTNISYANHKHPVGNVPVAKYIGVDSGTKSSFTFSILQ